MPSTPAVGRDKLYRAVQYYARFLAYYCLRKGYSKETVARLQALKSTLGLSRKREFFALLAIHLHSAGFFARPFERL